MSSDCPIHFTMLNMLTALEHITQNLNNMRPELARCRRCRGMDCPTLIEFNRRVDRALIAIRREWKMP